MVIESSQQLSRYYLKGSGNGTKSIHLNEESYTEQVTPPGEKFNLHLHQITIGAFCIRCQQQELYIFIRYHYKYNLNDVMIINHGLTFTQLRIMNYFVIKITRKLIMDACLVNIVLSPLTLSPLLVFNTF